MSATVAPSAIVNMENEVVATPDVLNIVVWGESGEGKSTLINLLLGQEVAATGKNPAGVTKDLRSYDVMIGGRLVRLWDLPGAGDKDVPAYRTMEMLGAVFADRPVGGLLLLSSNPERMPLGAQLVAQMWDMSFSGMDKWASVVLVGTKSDKYDEDDPVADVNNFKGPVLAEFNKTVDGDIQKVCTCNRDDVSEVKSMIELLHTENGMGEYQQQDPSRIAAMMCDLNGLPDGEAREAEMAKIIEQINADRNELQGAIDRLREGAQASGMASNEGHAAEEENRRREMDAVVDAMREQHRQEVERLEGLILEQARRQAEPPQQAQPQQQAPAFGFCIQLGPLKISI